jgi:two-component system, OmpR family, KDP operon response regulator KdpE
MTALATAPAEGRGGATRRILIVEDEIPFLHMLHTNLRRRGYMVEAATTGAQALNCAARRRPDAVILDLGLPDIDGFNVISGLRQWNTSPIIVLSARTAEAGKVAALDAGASDYVTKPCGIDEVMARLRAVLRDTRTNLDDQPLVKTKDFTIDLAGQQVIRDGRVIPLTRTEWQIVALLARHPNQLIPQQRFLAEIWGINEINNNYMRVFMVTIRRKLEPDPSHPRYFITEPGRGVRFLPTGPERSAH